MNILLSINYKFFGVMPGKLVELIKKYDKDKLIKGFEVVVNSKEDEKYLLNLAKLAFNEGYMINLHSPKLNSISEYKNYLDFAVEVSKIMLKKINVVFHPIDANTIEESEKITLNYVRELTSYILKHNYDNCVELSIENLNDIDGKNRLKKENLVNILEKEQSAKFTYDIGHEAVDGIRKISIKDILVERLNNIHIHTYNEKIDHYPIVSCEDESAMWVKEVLEKIIKNGYSGNVVMEYAIDYIDGNNFEKKMKKYIESAKNLGIISC